MVAVSNIVGVLLAGGKSQRMSGQEKALAVLGGETLLSRAVRRAKSQVSQIIVSGRSDLLRGLGLDLPVIEDSIKDFAGPLAGVLAALDWVAVNKPRIKLVASFAVDVPFFPLDLVRRMEVRLSKSGKKLCCAQSGSRLQPVFGLWEVSLREDLRSALILGERKVDIWTAKQGCAVETFRGKDPDLFFNINAPEDMKLAVKYLELVGFE